MGLGEGKWGSFDTKRFDPFMLKLPDFCTPSTKVGVPSVHVAEATSEQKTCYRVTLDIPHALHEVDVDLKSVRLRGPKMGVSHAHFKVRCQTRARSRQLCCSYTSASELRHSLVAGCAPSKGHVVFCRALT